MIISIKSKLFLSLSILVVSFALFQQSAFAISLGAIDDFSVTRNQKYKASSGSNLFLDVNSNELSFLKFNISSLKGQKINSAKLDLYGIGYGDISLFYVNNDDWVIESENKDKVTKEIINGLLGKKLDKEDMALDKIKYSFNFNSLSDLINDVNNNDEYFSLALKANSSSWAKFASSEFCFLNPTLEIATSPAPVPEPSSVLLGLIGLGSLLGLKRENLNKSEK